MRKDSFRERLIFGINITSLADISITLMIIFLIAGITATLSHTGLDIRLPSASYVKEITKEGVTITIKKSGEIYIEETPVTERNFPTVLENFLSRKETMNCFLKAEPEVPYGKIIAILGKIREVGVKEVSLIATYKRE
jgi:biopolymer transport protein TolR|uniref:Biopolymer transporter ExbD n=1 Tax=candidate division WOR-3 bacterium TaxID=2052148 RepID=A0A7C3YZG2_UNCW3